MLRNWFAFALCMAMAAPLAAQDLGTLEWTEIDASTVIFPDPTQSLLIVESTVVNLSFESNRGIISAEEQETGVWHVRLEPGVQAVTIRAAGFLPLKLPARPPYNAREARKIRVTGFGKTGGFDTNRPELHLRLEQAFDDAIFVQIDDNPPQKMAFQSGSVTLRPSTGRHTVKVFAGGRVWTKAVNLERGETYSETVEFTAAARETLADVQPGHIFIESEPPGATVFLNQVEQPGATPLTLGDLRPGGYTIEVVSDLYLPETRTVQVNELEYSDVKVELTPNFGRLYINTKPTGALVYINDQQRGTTPLEIQRFNAGQYRLRIVQQLYYEAQDTFRIEPGGGFEKTYELKPQFGSMTVTSTPPGAEVEVDGELWGTTPASRAQVFSGTHMVRVSKENYYPQEKQVEVFDGQHREMPFLLSSSVGFLMVESDPPGARVTIRETGQRLGRTPLKEIALDPGTYTLVIELEDHKPHEQSIPVSLAGTPPISVDLERKTGHLRVESDPPRATVYLNGRRQGQTPTVVQDHPTGTYTLRLEKSGHDSYEGTVVIREDETTRFNCSLGTEGTQRWMVERKRARLWSIAPGGGQFVSPGQEWRGYLYVGGIAAAGYMFYQSSQNYTASEDEYDTSMQEYHNANSQDDIDRHFAGATTAYDDMETANRDITMFAAVAGGVYLVSIADAWFFGGGPRPVTSMAAENETGVSTFTSVSNNTPLIGIQLRF